MYKNLTFMSRFTHEKFNLTEVDYQQYNVEFMMVDYDKDSLEEVYSYMYETEKTQWLNTCRYKGNSNEKLRTNALVIEECTPLNIDLAKLTDSYIYGQHVQILCYVPSPELQDNTRMGIRQAKCYVILNDTEGNSHKQLRQKLKELQKSIVPYGKNILEGKHNLDIEWEDCNGIVHDGHQLFDNIDYMRFIICPRQHYFEKTMKMMVKGTCAMIFKDFCRGSGRKSAKQRVTDVCRTGITLWPTPKIDIWIETCSYILQVLVDGWPFSNKKVRPFIRFGIDESGVEEHDEFVN